MKFIIQIPQLIYAGAEKVLISFANDLVSRGHEVEILEIYERGYLKPQFDNRIKFNCICSKEYTMKYYASLQDIRDEENIMKKLDKCSKLMFSKIVGYRRFAEKLASKHYQDKQYDVAINYLENESPKYILNHIHAKKYIQWIHIDVANFDDSKSMDGMIPEYEKMDAIVCVAESVKKSFIERYPQLMTKTCVIYNFFDVDIIKKVAMEPFQFYCEENSIPILLSVGRMTSQKNYIRFLKVLNRLKSEGYRFRWYLLGDGKERLEIEENIKKSHLENYVSLEGIVDNPYKYMERCDLFILPSSWEGFPTVTVEAKILNCAVLATEVSGIREQMVHGETGWIVENSEEGIYTGLKYLLDNPEIMQKIKSNFGIEKICDSEAKYMRLLSLVP